MLDLLEWKRGSLHRVLSETVRVTVFIFFNIYLFLEIGLRREKEKERNMICEKNIDQLLSHTPNGGPGPQPRHAP